MAIVAIPCSAREAARASEAPPPMPPPPPCLLPPTPWPKIATGHPPAGRGPDGRYRLKNTSLTPWTTGHPGLLVPGDTCHVAQVEHRPPTARPQEEVGR